MTLMKWVLSEENFLRSSSKINYLKLRGSYGSTGSENLYGARLYSWQSLYNTISIPSYSFGTGFSSAGSATAEASLPNDETTISMIIAKVVQSHPVKDMKMLEISTEEIIRNIYQEGMTNG